MIEPEREWPADLEPEAFHGIVGEIVRLIVPETEADPAALHASILTAAGNAIGRAPHFTTGADRHHPALFIGVVGPTAGGKGVSMGMAKKAVTPADTEWAKNRLVEGLSTGEGLIYHVRDPLEERRLAKDGETEDADGFVTEIVDPGIADKRVLVTAGEFAQVLTAAGREGNTLSPILRSLWDDGNAGSLTRSSPIRTTGAHVSIVAHITEEELRKKLTATDSANGFGNRFMWVAAKRARKLPFGGDIRDEDLNPLIQRLTTAIRDARRMGEMGMNLAAQKVWSDAYVNELTADREGLFGAITGRAHAISLRLTVLFAALDGCDVIEAAHVRAALATWRRAEASALYLFGDSTGDKFTDKVKTVLADAGPEGIRKAEIRERLGSHGFGADRINEALITLKKAGGATYITEDTGGRPAERWLASDLPPITPISPTGNGAGA